MKNRFVFLATIALFALCGTRCVPEYNVFVSTQDLEFGLEAESQTLIVTANCKWTITKNDDADWYTITPMSGRAKDSIVTITVNAYPGGDFRGSSFVVTSPGDHIRRTVFVTQNKLDFDGMINKIFGVTTLEHWVTDFYGQIIEDEYYLWEYNPYDTTQGYLMYFLEDGIGYQRDHHKEHAIYFPFTYEYDSDSSILRVTFDTDEGPEPYAAQVLCASDSLYRIFHQYKPNRWERADHRKVSTITPEEKSALLQKVAKRKATKDGIYHCE